ncbi:MAG: BtpA/SgcQ family protein [Planctomycetes bacterium]|nr:BtpA/SgcQ family protein [Planctomycetota bacterium]
MPGPLLGVVHLQPLPGSAGFRSMQHVLDRALADAHELAAGGFDGAIVENFGGAPFHKGTRDDPTPPHCAAALAVVADRIRTACGLPTGVNCLRNDGIAALGAAAVAGARWVRINVLAGAYVTDQGVIEGEAARVAAYRHRLAVVGQPPVQLLADFLVKHATPLQPFDVATGARDLAERSGADAIVLSGSRTGEPVDVALFDTVRAAVGAFPVWIGSGLTVANAPVLWGRCDGAIVGTSIKQGGVVTAPIDGDRVRALRAACAAVAG